MRVGLGLDFTLGLDFDDQAVLAREAAELGYAEIWTPEGAGIDSFQLCAMRWRASAEVTPGGLATGIAVSPVAYRTPMAFAMSAGTLGAHTGGRFVLGDRERRALPSGVSAGDGLSNRFDAWDHARLPGDHPGAACRRDG